MRVVLTGVTIDGYDIVEIFRKERQYVTLRQVVDALPLNLTATQKDTLTAEAVAALTEQRRSR